MKSNPVKIMAALAWIFYPLFSLPFLFLNPSPLMFIVLLVSFIALSIIVILLSIKSGDLDNAEPDYYGCHCYE